MVRVRVRMVHIRNDDVNNVKEMLIKGLIERLVGSKIQRRTVQT